MFLLVISLTLLHNHVMVGGQDTEQGEDHVEEGFFNSLDFQVLWTTYVILCYDRDDDLWTVQSILIGVGGFWGGVFCMGLLYLLAVLTKRVFKPEEAEKIAEWRDAEIFYTLYMQEVAEPEKIKTEPVNNLLEFHRSKVCTALSCCCFSSLLCILHRRLILTVGRFLDWGQTIESNRASEL